MNPLARLIGRPYKKAVHQCDQMGKERERKIKGESQVRDRVKKERGTSTMTTLS
jgi:hypothetical protein